MAAGGRQWWLEWKVGLRGGEHSWEWSVALTLKPGPSNVLCPARPFLLTLLKHFYHLTKYSRRMCSLGTHYLTQDTEYFCQALPSFLTLFCWSDFRSGCYQLHFMKTVISGVTTFKCWSFHCNKTPDNSSLQKRRVHGLQFVDAVHCGPEGAAGGQRGAVPVLAVRKQRAAAAALLRVFPSGTPALYDSAAHAQFSLLS